MEKETGIKVGREQTLFSILKSFDTKRICDCFCEDFYTFALLHLFKEKNKGLEKGV